jgi:hypothetical protein
VGRGYIVVEGHGEVEAARNLVTRLWQDLGLPFVTWADPIRGIALHTAKGIAKACVAVRAKKDADRLLILRDEDDLCPKVTGPAAAKLALSQNLSFPTAVVLFHREFETLFLPCLHLMAGRPLRDPMNIERPGLNLGVTYQGDYESTRGVKEWLSRQMPPGRSYKPTLDQLAMTRMIDFAVLRQSGLPCFGTLERSLRFLADQVRGEATVYPSPTG